jgi:hypothetical protein|uniref:Uncharacterized protein n=1 Tax=uncultured bacterium contig00037 TaxID=1181525 RepID=A0A806KAY3_9BACT|nr:hypothetical protein [uncultured bacterium contig00037]
MPGEYRKTAERLFPSNGFSFGKGPDLKTAVNFAEILGIGAEYQRVLSLDIGSAVMQVFLEHFQNNLDLLIQKTWVEKSDERRKEKLQDEVPVFMATIEKGDFHKAIEEFGAILKELAYLFFGAQSEKDDFTEYTFRIDAQMGLFWWYGGRLASLKELNMKNSDQNNKILWAVLLLGLCYLTNF